jgi:predicted PurR-regulated permease PerM
LLEDWLIVPPWFDRLAAIGWRVLVSVAFGLVIASIAISLSSVTASLLVALIAAAALAPTVRGLRARGMSPTLAAAIACVVGLVVVVVAVILLAIAIGPYADDVVAAVEAGVSDVRAQLATLGLPPVVAQAFDQFADAILAGMTLDVTAFLGPIASLVTVGVLGGFLTFFLLLDGDKAWAGLTSSVEPWRAEALGTSARAGLDRVGGYLRRTVALALIDALVAAIVLRVIGVPLSGPLVVVVFLGGFVPYLGAIVSTLLVGFATLALVGAPAALVMVAVLAVTSVASTRVLAPTSIGSGVDVHPVLVLAAILVGTAFFGILGLVVLLPATIFLLAVSKAIVVVLEQGSGTATAPPRPVRDDVPVWLDRLGQWSWRGLIVVAVIWVAVQAAISVPSLVVPAVLALVLTATLVPLTTRLQRAGWSRGLAAAVVSVGAALVVVAALVASVVWTVGPLHDIVDTSVEGADDLGLGWLGGYVDGIGETVIIDLAGLLRGAARLALLLILTLLLTFFFLRDGPAWWAKAIGRLQGARRERIDAAGTSAVGVLGGYMVGTAIIALFGAVTSALIMVVLGLPLALPVGVLTFFGGFIPYIGSFATTALAFLIAIAVGTTTDIVVMGVFTVIFNIIQGNIVTPLVYGRTLGLHPAVILMAIPAGNQIAGILGMFLIVPFVAVAAAIRRPLLQSVADTPLPAATPSPTEGLTPRLEGSAP